MLFQNNDVGGGGGAIRQITFFPTFLHNPNINMKILSSKLQKCKFRTGTYSCLTYRLYMLGHPASITGEVLSLK